MAFAACRYYASLGFLEQRATVHSAVFANIPIATPVIANVHSHLLHSRAGGGRHHYKIHSRDMPAWTCPTCGWVPEKDAKQKSWMGHQITCAKNLPLAAEGSKRKAHPDPEENSDSDLDLPPHKTPRVSVSITTTPR